MKPILFFDLETELFGPANMAPEPVCLSWSDGDRCELMLADRIESFLGPYLERAAVGEQILVTHGAFDFPVLLAHCERLRKLIWRAMAANSIVCTRVRERLLDIAEGTLRHEYNTTTGDFTDKGYDLADILRRRLDVHLDKSAESWRTRYGELKGIPISQWPRPAITYALDDSRHGIPLIRNQSERARHLHYAIPTQFEDTRADFALRLTQVWGIRTDGPRVEALWAQTQERMSELRQSLLSYDLVRVKKPGGQRGLFGEEETPATFSKKMDAIRGLIKSCYPNNDPPLTETKKISTAKNVLEICHHPGLDALVEFNSLEKSGSTYVRKLFDGIVLPIHAWFDSVGAESDRTACSGPNLQNQPRMPGVRECFITRKGRVFLVSDFDALEMRTWAQSCLDLLGRSDLADLFRKDPDFDPHMMFAAEQFLKISYAEGMRLKKTKDPHAKEMRQRAKAANFGFPGGLGALRFMGYAKGYGVVISFDEAKAVRKGWFDQWTEADRFFAHVRMLVGDANYGRQIMPRSGFMRGGVNYTNGANGYFQTPAAHGAKRAMFEAVRRCYDVETSMLYGSRPVWFIHDEIGLETPEEACHEAGVELSAVMVEEMSKTTPDVPSRASATAMRRWSKNAEPVYVDGRLVPWDEPARVAA